VFRAVPAAPTSSLALLSFAFVLALAGCGGGPRGDDGRPGRGTGERGAVVRPDTSRSGPAFLAIWTEGPLEELRVVRATDGRLVVAGRCAFPDGTRLRVALLASGEGAEAVPVAIVGARVETGQFMAPPLAGQAGPPPHGVHLVRVEAAFGPADQDPSVMTAAAGGRRYLGAGTTELPDGRIVFATTLEAPL
jgi:hypothetical protein